MVNLGLNNIISGQEEIGQVHKQGFSCNQLVKKWF